MKNSFEQYSTEKGKDKKYTKIIKQKTKDGNKIINKSDNKKRNRSNKKSKQQRKIIENNKSFTKSHIKNYNLMVGSKSNEKNLFRQKQKNKKENFDLIQKNVKLEYSLCQKEMQLLLDKEEELKSLKNKYRLQNNNYNTYITNSNVLNNNGDSNLKKIKSKHEGEDVNLTEIDNNNINSFKDKLKNNKKLFLNTTDINNDKLTTSYLKTDNNNKHHLNSSSKDKVNKNQVINKSLINKLKMKDKINATYYPNNKLTGNLPEKNIVELNKYDHKYTLSFKKLKKNIFSLNKYYHPTTDRSYLANKNSSNTTKKKKKSKKNIIKRDKLNKTNIDININNSISNISSENKSKTQNIFYQKNNKEEDKQKKEKIINSKTEVENDIEDKQTKVRSIDKIGILTKAGGEEGVSDEKTNQDNYFCSDISNGYKFIGVCDGHGEDGQCVSEYLKKELPKELDKELKKYISSENKRLSILECMLQNNRNEDNEEEKNGENQNNNEKKEKIKIINNLEKLEKIYELFKKVYITTNVKLIEENYMFNLENSGSTCVSIFLQKNNINKLYVANVGDSRAIIIREPDKNNSIWSYQQLSRDHKPSEKDEAERILRHGGEIEQIQNEKGEYEGPFRIFKKNEEGPGLAMSRSFGDVVGSMLGIVAEPEVTEYILKDEDKVIILASDGLYEYVSNEEITEKVSNFIDKNDANLIVDELYKLSYARWKARECGIDDITIICIILK